MNNNNTSELNSMCMYTECFIAGRINSSTRNVHLIDGPLK